MASFSVRLLGDEKIKQFYTCNGGSARKSSQSVKVEVNTHSPNALVVLN